MRDLWFQFQKECFILGIIDGSFYVFASEGTNSLIRLSERDEQKLCLPLRGATQDLNTPISWHRTLVFEARLHQVRKILFSLLCGGHSALNPGNHRCAFLLL
jgi:hypothetical protein